MNHLSHKTKMTFAELKEQSKLTPGILYSHCSILEKEGYIVKQKILVNDSFSVIFQITTVGIKELSTYIAAFEDFMDRLKFKLRGTYENMKYQFPPLIMVQYEDQEGNKFEIGEF